jgi:hypothetical protein
VKFSTEAELNEHGKVHTRPVASPGSQTQVMQFKCTSCGMNFGARAEMMEHIKRAHPPIAI